MENLDTIRPYLIQKKKYPRLETINGTGISLFGHFQPIWIKPLEFKMAWFCIFFIPIIPLGTFLIEVIDIDEYNFHGAIKFKSLIQLFGANTVFIFIYTIIFSSIIKILRMILIFTIVLSLYYLIKHYIF